VALAVVQMETPAALVATAYGRILAGKLAILTIIVALAAWNRFWLTPAIMIGNDTGRRQLIRSIAIEGVLAVAILGLVAGWRFTPPPRALAIAAAQPFMTHIHTAKAMADVEFTPGRAGPIAVRLSLLRGDFAGLEAKTVTVALENPAAGIEPIIRQATKASDGSWHIPDLLVPLPGRWKLTVDILIDDFDKVLMDTDIVLR
jgi:copper transport protein